MDLGSSILQSRQTKGWSQAQLAKVAKLSASAIAMYETNRRHPNSVALSKLEQVLGPLYPAQNADLPANEPPHDETKSQQDFASVTENKSKTDSLCADSVHTTPRTTLVVTQAEAHLLLFLRMHPECQPFLQSYTNAPAQHRERLERTWSLLYSFQTLE
ncbi:helix-turn-helix domain-containing protein [Alicyclobacillaceae bacterium I2511]|nr:helix-turn-helix domain-containing protein [Alicyclobacillaceae bacterium I2511]